MCDYNLGQDLMTLRNELLVRSYFGAVPGT
jgi:hypothetical protein